MATTRTYVSGNAAARVRDLLTSEDRTISWLSRKAGIPRSTLRYQLDVKPTRLTVDNLCLIAVAFERPLEQIVGDAA